MLEGFLFIYLGIAVAAFALGSLVGSLIATKNRKRGALIGAAVGLVLGCAVAPMAVFNGSAPAEVPTVVE